MAGWIEVPCYDFFLSTRSTIISLKLVADAACPGIIIRSLLSSTETREMLAMSTRTPPRQGGWRVGRAMAVSVSHVLTWKRGRRVSCSAGLGGLAVLGGWQAKDSMKT